MISGVFGENLMLVMRFMLFVLTVPNVSHILHAQCLHFSSDAKYLHDKEDLMNSTIYRVIRANRSNKAGQLVSWDSHVSNVTYCQGRSLDELTTGKWYLSKDGHYFYEPSSCALRRLTGEQVRGCAMALQCSALLALCEHQYHDCWKRNLTLSYLKRPLATLLSSGPRRSVFDNFAWQMSHKQPFSLQKASARPRRKASSG
jgi:hypothetical protein